MGYIMEKEQSYRDAANCYESAWKQTRNPAIGKLCFSHLRVIAHVIQVEMHRIPNASDPSIAYAN